MLVELADVVVGGGAKQAQALLTREGPHVLGMYVGNPVVAVCVAFV